MTPIPRQHSTVQADTLIAISNELLNRVQSLVAMLQVGDRFIFIDAMGTTTMEVQDGVESTYILDVLTEPTS